MKWTFAALAALSLAALIVSGWSVATFSIPPKLSVFVGRGQVHAAWTEPRMIAGQRFDWHRFPADAPSLDWGFDAHRTRFTMGGKPGTQTTLIVPIWALAACTGGIAAWLWWGEQSRTRPGRCPACRYPIGISTVCTECGHRLA